MMRSDSSLQIKLFSVALLILMMLAGCALHELTTSTASPDSAQTTPAFSLNDNLYFLVDASSVKPSSHLQGMGRLAGSWQSVNIRSTLEFSKVLTEVGRTRGDSHFDEDACDVTLVNEDGHHRIARLASSSAGFEFFALDIDSDGQDELLVHHNRGRGTSLAQRTLSIYQVQNLKLQLLFQAALTGRIWGQPADSQSSPFIFWKRVYAFERDRDEQTILKLWRQTAPINLLRVWSETDLLDAQMSTVSYRYDADRRLFVLADLALVEAEHP